jgi:pimeloyl-ACP methyl ester carboxylesterase
VLALLAACAGAPPTRPHRPEQDYATIAVNGIKLAYFASGDPRHPLVILLHGFPDTPHAWDSLRPALAESGYYVVAPFLRGYAPSQIPGEDAYDVRTLGRDVLDLIAALGKQSADVVGHDWGAMAAYSAAAQEPRRIRKLVAMVIPHPANIKPRLRDARRLRHFLALRKRSAERKFASDDYAGVDELYARWSPTWRSTPADREPVKNAFAARGSLHGALGYYRDLSRKALAFVRAPTRVPTLVIAGIDDGTTPLDSFDNKAPFAAGVRIEELPTGHFPHRERPDLVLPLLREFLGAPPQQRPEVPPVDDPPEVAREPERPGQPQDWPLDLARELPGGCLAWSTSERAVVCVNGGGSIQSGHTYSLAFLGERPETIKILETPPLDQGDHPLILPEKDRANDAARFTSGKYIALPPPTGTLTPGAPYLGARFTLRWTRKKTDHVDAGTGQWNVYNDRIELACKAKNPIFLPLFDTTIENPGKDDADVYVLSPTQILVHRVDVWGVEGDLGSREDAAFVDLDKLGCR